MPELEEVCRWDVKIEKSRWAKFKTGINGIVQRHGQIPARGKCVGNGFELYAKAEEAKGYVLMALSINTDQITPLLLIQQLREYMTQHLRDLIECEESYRKRN